MHLDIGDQRYDSQPVFRKSNSEVNRSCTHPHIRAAIVPPAIGMFIEAAGDTHKLDPDVLGCTVNSCEKQSLPTLPRVAIFPNLTIAGSACNRFEVCVAVNLCPPAVYSRFRR